MTKAKAYESKIPSTERLIDYLRARGRPGVVSEFTHKFNRTSPVGMRAKLRQLAEEGVIEELKDRKGTLMFGLKPISSGLDSIYMARVKLPSIYQARKIQGRSNRG